MSGTLHAPIPSHLPRHLAKRTVTQMSPLSQDCRRMISLLQELAPKPLPRAADLLSGLCCPTIRVLELKLLRIQWFIWRRVVKWHLIAFGVAANEDVSCLWKLSKSIHWFMYLLDWSLIAGEILTGCTRYPLFLLSTEILVYKDLFPFKSFFCTFNRADLLLFKVKYHCTFIWGSHLLPLDYSQTCIVLLWVMSQVSPQQKNTGRLFELLPKQLITGFFFV